MKFGLLACQVAIAALIGASAANASTLNLYTSQPDHDAAQTVQAFEKAYPDVHVQVYRSGTSDILSKLAAEFSAGNPQPDVLLIADAVSMETLKRDGRLMPFPDAKVGSIEKSAYDSDKTYFGTKLITTGIVYNTRAAEKPQHWADLAKPAYKNLEVMPSPLYSGAAAYLLAGFVTRKDLGWNYFEDLKKNNIVSVRGNGAVLKSVASGEKAYGVLVDFMAMRAKKEGSPVDFVFPSEGVPAVTEPVAILKTAKNVDDAKKFVNFLLSDKGQKLALDMGYLPANLSVGRPDWLPEGTKVKVMSFDMGPVVKEIDTDKKKFSKMFGG